MPVRSLGHAVLNVRSLDRAEEFYHGVLGLPIATRSDEFKMTFFTLGNHHDLAVRAVGEDAPAPDPKGIGLYHLAFCVGDSLDELRAMKERLEERGVKIDRVIDHNVTGSLYLRDPDGNGIELYVDTSDVWKKDPSTIAAGRPLAL
jgi:catechol 2,3-dioxygenase